MSKRFAKPFTFSSRKVLLSFVGALFVFSIITIAFVTRITQASQGNTQSQDGVWQFVEEASIVAKGERQIVPQVYRTVQANEAELKNLLSKAPLEFTKEAKDNRVVIALPMPDGSLAKFRVEESPIMEPALAAQYPEIKTYRGQGVDDPAATTRMDFTPAGFHAMILSERGTVYIDPYSKGDTANYITYYKNDYRNDEKRFVCHVSGDDKSSQSIDHPVMTNVANGTTLRTYRLALAATGEYTAAQGGTVVGALAAMTTSMNRVNAIYEREVAVRMIMVAGESSIIHTNSVTDPYSNDDGFAMLSQNQSSLTSIIGSANYDIGHVFSTGGGGVAGLGVVCSSSKARGVTGSPSPNGDGFDVDYVAHEMGHQFNGRHSFNGTVSNCGGGNRTASSAFEPGSGTTIMAYAGICGSQNIQPHSDDYFHVKSLEEIAGFIAGNSCDVETSTGNTPPAVTANANVTIPKSTPFTLTATGSDVNGDSITYCWEEYDLGTSSPPDTDATGSARPIFRSFNPTSSPSRTFPKMSDVLNNTSTYGEALPSMSRTMTFQVIARDNRAAGGGINTAITQVTVNANAGPFLVTLPNTNVTWNGGAVQAVTWDVANTAAAPVNAANVKISFSSDGGNTFPIVLAESTPNDGSEPITVPEVSTTAGRIKVEAVGNVFFDVSNTNFVVTPASAVTGSWTIGLFRPTGNCFFLRNTNSFGPPDIQYAFGAPGDKPVIGDWDGDGVMTVSLYRPSTSTFFLRNSNSLGPPDIILAGFGDGPGGDIPIAGDWNGDGTWSIGVFRPSTSTFFLRNSNTLGTPEIIVAFGDGPGGDLPLVGDWDGNGTTTIGLYRPSTNSFFLLNSNVLGPPDIQFSFGAPGDIGIAGDWDGNGTVTVGLFRPSSNTFFLRNTNTLGPPDITISNFGAAGDQPIVGDWDGL